MLIHIKPINHSTLDPAIAHITHRFIAYIVRVLYSVAPGYGSWSRMTCGFKEYSWCIEMCPCIIASAAISAANTANNDNNKSNSTLLYLFL